MSLFTLYIILQSIGIILVILSSISEAIMDTIMFHYDRSVFIEKQNQQFWNPELSWKNKYKTDLKTPKFPGSTTIFVFLTDAWHRHKFYRNTFLFIGLPLIAFFSLSFLNMLLMICIARLIFGLVFTYFYYRYSNKKLNIFKKLT